jgi:hypothetical protein
MKDLFTPDVPTCPLCGAVGYTSEHPGCPGARNLEEGKRLRDEGIASVSSNTSEEYKREFAALVGAWLTERRDWTSEDVTARIGFPPQTHPSAIGALTRGMAVRFGAIKVGRTKAQRAICHAAELTIWGWRA